MNISPALIIPNPRQPRQDFDAVALQELAESMRENGQAQPVTVEENPDGTYTLIAGERRLLAAKSLNWETIRADVRPHMNGSGDKTRLILALVENLNRSDMHPLDEALAFQALKDEFGMSQAEIGVKIGKGANGQAYVNHRLMLLKVEPEIQILFRQGWHTTPELIRALLVIPDSAARVDLAKKLFTQTANGRRLGYKACTRAALKLADAMIGKALMQGEPGYAKPTEKPASPTSSPAAPSFPALALAKKRARVSDPDESPKVKTKYNALVHTGLLPPWPGFRGAVEKACKKCAWYMQANELICKECPAVDILEDIMRTTQA